jgi:hypothetical protein
MNDTPANVQAEFRRRLRATDATRRLRMMSGMFSAAKSLARARIQDGAGPPEAAIFRRMYRTDFTARQLAGIAEHLRTAHSRRA